LGVSIPVGSYLKFNADLITKNSITTNNKESQSYSEEIEIDYDETFKIPAKSILKYRYTAIKGLIKAQIRGKVIIDALFTYRLRDGDGHDHYFDIWTSNTHLLPNSQDRMVDYSGEITNEGYEHLDIIKKADKIEDPKVCEWLAVFR
jgi:hypothetical protein